MIFGDIFLNPSVPFPLQERCEPWGEEELVIDFAGGPYHFSGLSVIQAEAIRARFRDQCISPNTGSPQGMKSVVCRIDPVSFKDVNMDGGWLYECMDYVYKPDIIRLAGIQLLAQLNLGTGLSAAMWTPLEGHDWFSGIVFENFFRVLVSYRLLTLGAVLLHSSAMVDAEGKEALLFLGPSGAGKSTIAELGYKAGYQIISDDLNAVIPRDGQFFVEKVPFSGTFVHGFCRGSSYPLHSIYRIMRGRENVLKQIGKADALSGLISCASFVNKDRYRFNLLTDNLGKIIEGVSAFRLDFSLNGRFLDLI